MPDLAFAQPERRNYAPPVLIALAFLCLVCGLLYRSYSRRVVLATVTQTKVHALVTTYKEGPQRDGFTVLKKHVEENDLYIVPTVRIQNHLAVPLFLKDFTITLMTTDGEMHTAALESKDLETTYNAVPAIKPSMATPMLRESEIAPGQTAEGSILAQFAIPQSTWDQRQAATLTIDFYHQPSMTIQIPKSQL